MSKNLKSKKISVAAFDKVMKENGNTETVKWNDLEIVIRKTLPLKDALTFVDTVAKGCFDSDNNYLPEVKVFAIKCCVLEMYANFALPSNVEHKYDLIYNTDAFDAVIKHINMRQFNEIVDTISEKIDYMAQVNLDSIYRQMNDIYNTFDNLQEQISTLFSGVNAKDMAAFIQTVASGELDEEKIVHTYMNHANEMIGE